MTTASNTVTTILAIIKEATTIDFKPIYDQLTAAQQQDCLNSITELSKKFPADDNNPLNRERYKLIRQGFFLGALQPYLPTVWDPNHN